MYEAGRGMIVEIGQVKEIIDTVIHLEDTVIRGGRNLDHVQEIESRAEIE